MKCHNCKTEVELHEEQNECNHFQMDIPDDAKVMRALLEMLYQDAREDASLTAKFVIQYIRTLRAAPENRKALDLSIKWTPKVLAEGVESYFDANPDDPFNCLAMDKFIGIWTREVQHAKPKSVVARRAFRYVLVNGERDW